MDIYGWNLLTHVNIVLKLLMYNWWIGWLMDIKILGNILVLIILGNV